MEDNPSDCNDCPYRDTCPIKGHKPQMTPEEEAQIEAALAEAKRQMDTIRNDLVIHASTLPDVVVIAMVIGGDLTVAEGMLATYGLGVRRGKQDARETQPDPLSNLFGTPVFVARTDGEWND